MSLIADYPFDESKNSLVAYDYSANQRKATIHNCTFRAGKKGYALHGEGNGYAKLENPPLNIQGNFTVIFWHRAKHYSPYSAPTGLLFQFLQDDVNATIKAFSAPLVLNKWDLWAFSKQGDTISIFKNCTSVGAVTLPDGDLSEWAIKQTGGAATTLTATLPFTFGANTSPYMQGDIDSLMIFDSALSGSAICEYGNSGLDGHVLYWVDGIKFTDYDCYVSDSKGVVNALEMKTQTQVDWANEHGLILDTRRPRYRPREIELKCFMPANSNLEFAAKISDFFELFLKPNTHRLKIEIDKKKPLVYEVIAPEGAIVDKQWRQSDLVGTFTLKLQEPEPVKRVLRFFSKQSFVINPNPITTSYAWTAYIIVKCKSPLNIYWGDGFVTRDVIADDYVTVKHSYLPKGSKFGTYADTEFEIIITGNIDDITDFMTNCIVVWNKL